MDICATGGEEFLLLVQVGAAGRDNPLRVKHDDILLLGTNGHIKFGTRDGSSTGTVDYNLHFLDILAVYFQRILQTSG